ncbi:MAG: amino acid ABC transporter permease [Betaproteobacteria bacterium]|nr:amino acid ABC transporter permease [Betaproteobacteria bacterium]MDE2478686.1 amino acid ABC transporter permease [Betaproteobacteria bacterium]
MREHAAPEGFPAPGGQRPPAWARVAGWALGALAVVVLLLRLGLPHASGVPAYHWHFNVIWQYRHELLAGLWYTVVFTVVCIVCGFLFGLLTALARISGLRALAVPVRALIELFRCTPLLVQLVWIYYALPVLTGLQLSAPVAAAMSLSLYGGAFYSEIIRGGILSIERGQSEAGQALGMMPLQVMRRIVLPQAFRKMVPPLVSQSIMQLKNTSLLSVIAVPDLLYQAQSAAQATYRPLELYTAAAVIYFLVLFPATLLAQKLEIQDKGAH